MRRVRPCQSRASRGPIAPCRSLPAELRPRGGPDRAAAALPAHLRRRQQRPAPAGAHRAGPRRAVGRQAGPAGARAAPAAAGAASCCCCRRAPARPRHASACSAAPWQALHPGPHACCWAASPQVLQHRLAGPSSPFTAYISQLPVGIPGIPMFFGRWATCLARALPATCPPAQCSQAPSGDGRAPGGGMYCRRRGGLRQPSC
jgi:hypothetical protein